MFTMKTKCVLGFAAVLVGSGIITSVLSTRIHLLATTIISFFYSAVLYPIVAHWLWVDHGWMQVNKTIIKDYAGGLAVHTTASTFASVGAIVLGRRLLRLSDISEISVVGVEVSKNTIAGYMFVIIGFIAFSLPTPEEEFRLNYNKFNGVLFTNSVMSLSAAGLVTILLDVITNYKKAFTYWSILKYLQAAIGGLVALSCGVDTFSPFASFLVGLVAGMLFFFTAALVSISFIEDNCNIVASSFICSFLASLLSQMISKNTIIIHLKNFTWQMSCHLIIFVTSFAFATVIILLLYASNRLKTKREKINHERATATYKMNKRPSYKKLFSVSSSAGYLEPGLSNKAITNNENSAGEGNVASKNVKPKTSHVEESNESIITQISSSDTDFVISKRNSKIINLQESTSKTKKSHL